MSFVSISLLAIYIKLCRKCRLKLNVLYAFCLPMWAAVNKEKEVGEGGRRGGNEYFSLNV